MAAPQRVSLRRRHCGSSGANPGPDSLERPLPTKPERERDTDLLECIAVNVTSARVRIATIRKLGADILLVTEPRATEGLKASLAWDLRCPAADDDGHALP